MRTDTIVIREATAADMPGISRVRLSVVENATTAELLARRGITNESVAASFLADSKGWVADEAGEIVAFSVADRATRSIFALFVLPSHEGRGLGSQLLGNAVQWLWDNSATCIWLTTGPGTRAARFYQQRGWIHTGPADRGDIRFELTRDPLAGS
jgi:GNAT superfamily N-acetyltransferase